MPESKNLPEKEHKLPAVMSASNTSLDSNRSTAVSKRTAITAALASFAPLALDVAYGLARKWLSGVASKGAVSSDTGKTEIPRHSVMAEEGQSIESTGHRRRWRGGRI
jgi:hypothetical protein